MDNNKLSIHTKTKCRPSKHILGTSRRHLPKNFPRRKADAHKHLTHKNRSAREYPQPIPQLMNSTHTCGFCGMVFTKKKIFISHLLRHNEEKLEALDSSEHHKNNESQVGQKQECFNRCQNQSCPHGQKNQQLKAYKEQKQISFLNSEETLNQKTLNQGRKQKQKVFKYCLRQRKENFTHCKAQELAVLEHLGDQIQTWNILDNCREDGQSEVEYYREQNQNQDILDNCPKQDLKQDVPVIKGKDIEDPVSGQELELDEDDTQVKAEPSILSGPEHQDDFLTNGCLKSPTKEPSICNIPTHDGSEYSSTICSDKKESNVHITGSKGYIYFCKVCGKGYSQRGSLTNHESSHTGEGAHRCSICDEIFNKKSFLRRHMHEHHIQDPPVCSICRRTFKSDSHLKTHLSVHRDFTCDLCGKKFAKKHHLKFHQFSHSHERPLKCETCGKGFKNNYGLRTHQLCHTEKRRHICELCGKGFKISSHLNRHLLGHTEMRNFTCVRCGKSFKQKCHLKVHMYSHTGERRFHCDACGKGFTQNSYLEKHQCGHKGDKLSSDNETVKTFNTLFNSQLSHSVCET